MSKLIKKALSGLYLCGVMATAAYAVVLAKQDYRLWHDIQSFQRATHEQIVDSDILATRWYIPKNTLTSDHGPSRFTLLVVIINDCTPCRDALKEWRNLLETTSIGSSLRIAVAQPDAATRAIWPVADGVSLEVQALNIRDPVEFSIGTGIRHVPLSLLFDNERRVRAAIGGVPSDLALRTILSIVVESSSAPLYTEHSNNVDVLIDQTAETNITTR